jgi:hypothetical protein
MGKPNELAVHLQISPMLQLFIVLLKLEIVGSLSLCDFLGKAPKRAFGCHAHAGRKANKLELSIVGAHRMKKFGVLVVHSVFGILPNVKDTPHKTVYVQRY